MVDRVGVRAASGLPTHVWCSFRFVYCESGRFGSQLDSRAEPSRPPVRTTALVQTKTDTAGLFVTGW